MRRIWSLHNSFARVSKRLDGVRLLLSLCFQEGPFRRPWGIVFPKIGNLSLSAAKTPPLSARWPPF